MPQRFLEILYKGEGRFSPGKGNEKKENGIETEEKLWYTENGLIL